MSASQRVLAVLISLILFSTSAIGARAEDTLGVSMQVIQGSSDASADLAQNNNLWFLAPPGETVSRSFNLRSASSISQLVHLEVMARKSLNGVLELDSQSKSVVSNWTSFSRQDFNLPARQSETITMTIRVPLDAEVNVYEPALVIQVKSASKSKSQYKVPNALQFVQGMFVGAGTTDQIAPNFTIEDVYGASTTDGHQLIIDLKNTGKTPLQLTGSLQLSNATFAGPVQGPYNFFTDIIAVGATGHAYVPVGPEITEDRWKIFADVKQGGVNITKTLVKDIRFSQDDMSLIGMLSGASIFIGLTVALISIRILRRLRRQKSLEAESAAQEREAELARIADLEAQLATLKKPRAASKSKPIKSDEL